METSFKILCFVMFILALASCTFGVKFLKKRNYLLGIEWLIVTFSASNFLLYALAGMQAGYDVSYFCDAFSRGFGIPLIAVAGLMAVTHSYKPSALADTGLFSVALAGGVILVAAHFITEIKPYFYLATWTIFSIYLAYFARRLQRVGEQGHAIGVTLVLLTSQLIASIYDFYHIPGDDQHVVFYILAGLAWTFLCVEMYYAYCALERHEQDVSALQRVHSMCSH